MRCEIEYLGLKVEPLELSYEFYRDIRRNGKPTTMVLGGGVSTKVEVNDKSMRFLEEMLSIDERCKNWDLPTPSDSECYKKIVVKVYDDNDYNIRTLELLDSYIANFKELFLSANNHFESNNYVRLEFKSASQIINKGATKNVFGWYITNPFEIDEYKSPVNAIETTINPEIIKGYWTSDKEGNEPLQKSKLGETAFFQIETKDINDGEKLELRLGEYDYAFWFDNLDPDDYEFPVEEVKKTITVKDNKATVELFLEEIWEKVVKDDHDNWFQSNESIELYWEVSYKNRKKQLPQNTNDYLRVAQSDRTLYFKTPTLNHNLPEFISNGGDPMLLMEFGKGFVANKLIEKGLDIAKDKAQEQISNIVFAKLKKGHLVDNTGKVYTGKRLIYRYKEVYNNAGELFENVEKGKNFTYTYKGTTRTTKGISQYDYFSKNGKRVTVLGVVKKLGKAFDIFNLVKTAGEDLDMSEPLPLDTGPLSPIFDLAGVLVQQQKAETDMWLEETIQEEIDLAKLQGLEATRKAINTWNHNKDFRWELMAISAETANKLLAGEFKTFDELEESAKQDIDRPNDIKILYRKIYNDNKEDYVYVIETIFINE